MPRIYQSYLPALKLYDVDGHLLTYPADSAATSIHFISTSSTVQYVRPFLLDLFARLAFYFQF